MPHKILVGILLAIFASFCFLESAPLKFFNLWSAIPLVASYVLFRCVSHPRPLLFAAYGFFVASVALSYLFYVAWYVDWRGFQSGSSTSALILVFAPLYAVVIGGAGYLLGFLIGKLIKP